MSGKGKRGPSWATAASDDEDKTTDQDPQDTEASTDFSADYDNVSSPGNSSTASGPTYVRQPGFTHHAHEVVCKPKVKKKKTALLSVKDGFKRRDPTPPKCKPKREPLPMRLRALPQSFWQQPNKPQNIPPGVTYPVLPPLNKDTEEVMEVRPTTPPEEKERSLKPTKPPERKITVANTDLLFKLFEGIGEDHKKANHLKRGRPKKVVPSSNKTIITGEDPYLVDAVSEKLFPQLCIEHGKAQAAGLGTSSLQLVTIREGDKSVTLPSLSVEQNYSQMLSELVMHI